MYWIKCVSSSLPRNEMIGRLVHNNGFVQFQWKQKIPQFGKYSQILLCNSVFSNAFVVWHWQSANYNNFLDHNTSLSNISLFWSKDLSLLGINKADYHFAFCNGKIPNRSRFCLVKIAYSISWTIGRSEIIKKHSQ